MPAENLQEKRIITLEQWRRAIEPKSLLAWADLTKLETPPCFEKKFCCDGCEVIYPDGTRQIDGDIIPTKRKRGSV